MVRMARRWGFFVALQLLRMTWIRKRRTDCHAPSVLAMTEVFGSFRSCLAAECIEKHVIPRLRSSRGNPFPTGGNGAEAKGSPCRGAAERSEAEGFAVLCNTLRMTHMETDCHGRKRPRNDNDR